MHCVFINEPLDYLGDNKFDFLFSHEVMEHCINPHKVLAYLSDHLNMGALIYLSVGFTAAGFHLIRNRDLFGIEKNEIADTSGNYLWRDCIKNAGLSVLSRTEDRKSFLEKTGEVNWKFFDFS